MNMRVSSLSKSPVVGVASTHFKPIDIVSACHSWMRSMAGDRISDSSGKKSRIGALMFFINPRSTAIPSRRDATLFEADIMLCGVSASKTRLSTRRLEIRKMRPGTSSEPVKYLSNASLLLRATRMACTLAVFDSRSAIRHSASRSTSLSSPAEATGQPSSRATGTPHPSGGSANTGDMPNSSNAAPPRSLTKSRRRIRSYRLIHVTLRSNRSQRPAAHSDIRLITLNTASNAVTPWPVYVCELPRLDNASDFGIRRLAVSVRTASSADGLHRGLLWVVTHHGPRPVRQQGAESRRGRVG